MYDDIIYFKKVFAKYLKFEKLELSKNSGGSLFTEKIRHPNFTNFAASHHKCPN